MKPKLSYLKNKTSFYESLQNLKPEQLQHVMKHLDDKSIDDICECVYNTLFTDLNIPTNKKNKLKKHLNKHCCKANLKIISSKNRPISRRRKALQQEGKGLGIILSTIVPLLTSLFAK